MNTFISGDRARKLLWLGIFLTGLSALLYQNIWHRYLSIMLGAEAKSSALVVSLFLIGLSIGSYYWGLYTQKATDKHHIIMLYAKMEFALALYGLFFPFWFMLIHKLSIALPQWFFIDVLLASFLIIPPTFLMGGTIPLLTTVLPKDSPEVADMHRWIYGINTFGAFLGAAFGGIPISSIGMGGTCALAAIINLLCGVIFLKNDIQGKTESMKEFTSHLLRLKPWHLIASSFLSGTVIIAAEMLCIRLVGLAIGPSHIVFPLVISVFILFLSLAAIYNGEMSENALIKNFTIGSLFFLVPVLTGHLWPLWTSLIRLRFGVVPLDYMAYVMSIFLGLCLILGPAIFFIGRTLPLSYSLYPKTKENFGLECGKIYALNTLGTFLGAVILGHLLWGPLSIEHVFKVSTTLVIVFALFLSFYKGSIAFNIVLALALFVNWMFPWTRTYHMESLYRKERKSTHHEKGLFTIMPYKELGWNNLYFEDGPVATVAVNRYNSSGGFSILTNGKSDSSTTGDLSTIFFAGALPYLYHPSNISAGLRSLVVGLGTGVTAGFLGKFAQVKHVDVAEISETIAEALPKFDAHSFDASKNPRIKINLGDAFRFLSRADKYDIIVSEPTNPWVVGTENLFTQEYYRLVQNALNPGGLFAQWFHLYSMSKESLSTVFHNYSQVFPEYCLIQTSTTGDILILNVAPPCEPTIGTEEKMKESIIKTTMIRMGMPPIPASLSMMMVYDSDQIKDALSKLEVPQHSLYRPTLGKMAWRNFFQRDYTQIQDFITPLNKIQKRREVRWLADSITHIAGWIKTQGSPCFSKPYPIGYNPFCENWRYVSGDLTNLIEMKVNITELFEAYMRSREFHYIGLRLDILSSLEQKIKEGLAKKPVGNDLAYWTTLLYKLMEVYTREKRITELKAILTWAQQSGHITALGFENALVNFKQFYGADSIR